MKSSDFYSRPWARLRGKEEGPLRHAVAGLGGKEEGPLRHAVAVTAAPSGHDIELAIEAMLGKELAYEQSR